MIGVIVNVIVVLIGSLIGLMFKKRIPERIIASALTAMGLCVTYLGISGALDGRNPLSIIISMVIGAMVGTALDIDRQLNRLGAFVESKVKIAEGHSSVGESMVSATLMCCVGAMSVVGSLNAGISGDNTLLFTKAVLDFFTALLLSVSLGYGVIFSVVPIFLYQGSLVLLARFLQPLLTESIIADLNCAGSLMILALGLNVLKITNIKVANLLPALLLSPFVTALFDYVSRFVS